MKGLSKNFRFIPLLALLGLVGTSLFLSKNARLSGKLLTTSEGVNTCFQRVFQSYTAKLLADQNSAYLDQSFSRMTEECFGEVSELVEASQFEGKSVFQKGLNQLMNDVHWFHQRLEKKSQGGLIGETPENVLISNLAGRFEKLELKKDEITKILDQRREQMSKSSESLNTLFLIMAILAPLLIFIDVGIQAFAYRKRSSLESDVAEYISKEEDFRSDKSIDLIRRSLEYAGLVEATKLTDLFKARNEELIEKDQVVAEKTQKLGPRQVYIAKDKAISDAEIDRIWEQTDREPAVKTEAAEFNSDDYVDTESVLGGVIDVLSSKIFTKGIKVNFDSENVLAEGGAEALEQVFYHVVSHSLDSFEGLKGKEKSMSIQMRGLGSLLLIDFYDTGKPFNEDFIKGNKNSTDSIELSICDELLRDIGGSISFNHHRNGDGQILGKKIQLSLKAAPSSAKLVYVEKTTKKELKKRLAQSV